MAELLAGKSWALLLEPLRHVGKPEFSAVFFRRNTTQVRNPGGLWDESMKLYPATGGVPAQSVILWQWPGGGKVKFAPWSTKAASWIGKARRFR